MDDYNNTKKRRDKVYCFKVLTLSTIIEYYLKTEC